MPWSVQAVNTNPELLVWSPEHSTVITVLTPGLWNLTFGFFSRSRPAVVQVRVGDLTLCACLECLCACSTADVIRCAGSFIAQTQLVAHLPPYHLLHTAQIFLNGEPIITSQSTMKSTPLKVIPPSSHASGRSKAMEVTTTTQHSSGNVTGECLFVLCLVGDLIAAFLSGLLLIAAVPSMRLQLCNHHPYFTLHM